KLKLLSSFLLFSIFIFKAFSHTGKDTLTVQSVSKPEKTAFYQLDELDSKFPLPGQDFRLSSEPEFTFENIKNEYKTGPSINSLRTEALSKFEEIDKEGKWIETLSNEDVSTLPVGIKHDVNGVEYAIGIVKTKINPQYTELTVFARIVLPQSDEKGDPITLFFGADNVKFSHKGGIIGDANLVLLGDVFIPFNGGSWLLSLKGAFDYKSGNVNSDSNSSTYVTISCDGI